MIKEYCKYEFYIKNWLSIKKKKNNFFIGVYKNE